MAQEQISHMKMLKIIQDCLSDYMYIIEEAIAAIPEEERKKLLKPKTNVYHTKSRSEKGGKRKSNDETKRLSGKSSKMEKQANQSPSAKSANIEVVSNTGTVLDTAGNFSGSRSVSSTVAQQDAENVPNSQ